MWVIICGQLKKKGGFSWNLLGDQLSFLVQGVYEILLIAM
jgi:hypothetical protein